MYIFGVDLGGTTVKMGYFTGEGKLLDKWEIPTDKTDNGKNILPDIAAAILQKMDEEHITADDVKGIGIGVPGPVDSMGNVLKCVNLGWGVLNVQDEMKKLTGISCKAGNDANVAALGEVYCGGGEGFDDVIMITLGTGVGGGVILDGQILAGNNGAAAEIGHFPMVDDETDVCGCGKRGCLEQYASATGIARLARKRLEETTQDSILRTSPSLSAKAVLDAAKAGDAMAVDIMETVGQMLGKACAMITVVVDPQLIVIGGGVSKAGQILIDLITKYYKQYAFHASANVNFALAKLGNDAGIYGGVKMVLQMDL